MVAVGRVEPKAVRIWIRSARPGRVTVRADVRGVATSAHTALLEIPPDDPADGTAAAWLPAVC